MSILENIKKIHKEINGKCQKCSQKCDKRVVSLITEKDDTLMVCPDCKQGKERPFFTPTENSIKLVSHRCEWEVSETNQFLQFFPLGIALINHNENTREYWNWDKSKHIRTIETDHEGNYLHVSFYRKPIQESPTDMYMMIVDGVEYPTESGNSNKTTVGIRRIHIPEEIKDADNLIEKVAYRIEQYKENGKFSKVTYVTRGNKSKSKPYTLLDGYSIYLASKEMGLTNIAVRVLGKPFSPV